MTPVLQFLIGVVVYGEDMPAGRLAGFALVWVALAVFTADAVGSVRRGMRPAVVVEPGAAEPGLAAASAPSGVPAR
jgi:chloramphenicol-sensitive protein RarD